MHVGGVDLDPLHTLECGRKRRVDDFSGKMITIVRQDDHLWGAGGDHLAPKAVGRAPGLRSRLPGDAPIFLRASERKSSRGGVESWRIVCT
jgi:hypothetical protein